VEVMAAQKYGTIRSSDLKLGNITSLISITPNVLDRCISRGLRRWQRPGVGILHNFHISPYHSLSVVSTLPYFRQRGK
jgi:hypothetical protein